MGIPATLSSVPAQTPYIQYVATSGQTVFPYPFEITQDSDLIVVINGVTQATDSGYSLSGVGNSTGGNLTFTSGRTANDIVTMYRDIEIERISQIAQNSGFSSTTFNAEFNQIYLILQQLAQAASPNGFSLQVPNTNSPAPTTMLTPAAYANKYLSFDAHGNPTPAQLTSSGSITAAIIAGLLFPETAAETSASSTPTSEVWTAGNVLRYGADPTGVNDSTAAFNAAIAQAALIAATSAEIAVPPGTYLIGGGGTGLTINANGIRLRGSGMGATTLKANSNGIWVLKIAQSNCGVSDILIDGNGHTTVDGLVFAPADETITGTTNQNNYCTTRSIQIQNCNNGLRMRPGPTVTGVDSGCFYNEFWGVFALNCTRGIWLENAVNAGSAGANRCTFTACRVGSSGTVSNTGLQIDNATTCQFFGLHCEGISNGTSPNTTPTAVQIASANSASVSNDDNHFFGCMMEANTRDLDNSNARTALFGGVWTATKFGGGGITPAIILGTDPSVLPTILPGMEHGEGVSGYPSGFWGMTKEIADYSGSTYYNWQAYALTTSNVTNAATVGSTASKYRQLSDMVSWHFTLQFKATSGSTEVDITPPIAPNAALYTTIGSKNSYYTLTVYDSTAAGHQVEAGWTSTGTLYVNATSGGWSTTGNNAIYAVIEYHV